jgi:hypothetical protein
MRLSTSTTTSSVPTFIPPHDYSSPTLIYRTSIDVKIAFDSDFMVRIYANLKRHMDEADENEKDKKETAKPDKTREDDLARTKEFER